MNYRFHQNSANTLIAVVFFIWNIVVDFSKKNKKITEAEFFLKMLLSGFFFLRNPYTVLFCFCFKVGYALDFFFLRKPCSGYWREIFFNKAFKWIFLKERLAVFYFSIDKTLQWILLKENPSAEFFCFFFKKSLHWIFKNACKTVFFFLKKAVQRSVFAFSFKKALQWIFFKGSPSSRFNLIS